MANEDNLQRCTVRLNLADSQGTGFFVAAGWILTCAHVVESAQDNPVRVFWKAEKRNSTARVKQLYKYPIDLALLKLEGDNFNHPCVELDVTEPNLNDNLYIFGYPKDAEVDYSQGDSASFKYEGISYKDDDIVLYKLKQGQLIPGFSGSPLLNLRTGKVCGIVHLSRNESTDLGGRAVSAEVILQKFPEIAQLNKQFYQQQPPRNHPSLTKEDRDNLKKDLLNSGLINNQDGRETLCMDIGIFDQAIYIGLPERTANDFATYLVNWLHKNNNQTALNNLRQLLEPFSQK